MDINEVKKGTSIYEIKESLPVDICAEMIDFFEKCRDEQYTGVLGEDTRVELETKRSTDLELLTKSHWKKYDSYLFHSLSEGQFLLKGINKGLSELPDMVDHGYQLQRTKTGEFYKWHCDGSAKVFTNRIIVAIWYLNDIEEGGETQFLYQDVKIKPEAGKLLLFPPYWTHTHQGAPVLAGTKYIATTWLCWP